ncbi:hypothetical protein BJP34_34660 [Moorena producens PAL-8-15-08-1]|uniref:Insertion element IS402-like domain-containing protein n=1 Tax=Moorena producens PAL-8-15-08-1 TaxID=1458985 RepID=A0A1D8U278_9CYAN|nr:transposase [Moorena producens]AOX03894.1 hypothetical protein BJP34_34660 [Moorena producens PAL-8-15-08-1]
MPHRRESQILRDLSNTEWEVLKPLLAEPKGFGHPRTVDLTEILNGVCYVQRTGCQVDSLRLLIGVLVRSANASERLGAVVILSEARLETEVIRSGLGGCAVIQEIILLKPSNRCVVILFESK